MNRRGFTIIELLVVIVVLVILASVTTTAYIVYQDRAITNQARSLSSAVKAGSERYFTKNNEYPSAQSLFGGTPTGAAPASYQAASDTINVSASLLGNNKVPFVPCAGASCTFTDKAKVYFLTKPQSAPAVQQQYVISGCTFTFPATDTGSASFLLTYWDTDKNSWIYVRSNNGALTTSDATSCPFSSS